MAVKIWTYLKNCSARGSWRVTLSWMAATCAGRRGLSTRSEQPQIRKINHPRLPLLETARIDGVKAPLHFKTRRSHFRVRVQILVRVPVELARDVRHARLLLLLLLRGLRVPRVLLVGGFLPDARGGSFR